MLTKQRIGPMSRWGYSCILATAVASAPPSVLAAYPGPALFAAFRSAPDVEQKTDAKAKAGTEPKAAGANQEASVEQEARTAQEGEAAYEVDVELEVEVSDEIVEAAELQRWIHDEGRRVLNGLPAETKRRGGLRVEIGGALYDYQVTISVLRDDTPMGFPRTWQCECSNEELLEKLRAELTDRAAVLELEEEPEPPPEPVIKLGVAPVELDRKRKRGRLGPAGVAGLTLMALGTAGVGAGVALMEVGKLSAPGGWWERDTYDLLPPGAVLVGTSVSLVVIGFVVHMFRARTNHHRRARVAAVGPTTGGANQLSLTVNGRF